jgi:hypothetical protein
MALWPDSCDDSDTLNAWKNAYALHETAETGAPEPLDVHTW